MTLNSFIALALISISATAQAQTSVSPDALSIVCSAPGRNQAVCERMRLLRAELNLLDQQRDFAQLNFPLLQAITEDMALNIERLLMISGSSPHLEALGQVRDEARRISKMAQENRVDAYRDANSLKTQCLACHSSVAPRSGIPWEKIAAQSWDEITNRCNEAGRNPVLCKSMHGMRAMLLYMESASLVGSINYVLLERVGREFVRLIDQIVKNRGDHGRYDTLSDVRRQAQDLITLAKKRDAQAYRQGETITQSCQTCHGPDASNSPQTGALLTRPLSSLKDLWDTQP